MFCSNKTAHKSWSISYVLYLKFQFLKCCLSPSHTPQTKVSFACSFIWWKNDLRLSVTCQNSGNQGERNLPVPYAWVWTEKSAKTSAGRWGNGGQTQWGPVQAVLYECDMWSIVFELWESWIKWYWQKAIHCILQYPLSCGSLRNPSDWVLDTLSWAKKHKRMSLTISCQ